RVVGPALGPRDYVVPDGSSSEALRSADLATIVRASEDDSTEPLLLGRARSRPTSTPIVVAPRHRPLLSSVRRGTVPSRGEKLDSGRRSRSRREKESRGCVPSGSFPTPGARPRRPRPENGTSHAYT